MTDNQLAPFNALFTTNHPDPNRRSRLKKFSEWLNVSGKGWHDVRLDEYRDYLLYSEKLSPISVRNHLATVRQRYRDILEDNEIIASLEAAAFLHNEQEGFEPNPANVQAVVNKWLRHIQNNISPRKVEVKVTKAQEHEDSKFIRLTPGQIDERLRAIGRNTFQDYRDAALCALLYSCGLREAEGAALIVDDLYQTFQGAPALRVSKGKGSYKRMVVYGSMWRYISDYVLPYLNVCVITSGKVLRTFDMRSGKMSDDISVDTIQRAVFKHMGVKPHDLRRSYAKNLRDSGMAIDAIRQQLGHKHIQTTLSYIGELDAGNRTPEA